MKMQLQIKDTAAVLETSFVADAVLVSHSEDLSHSLSRRASSIISDLSTSIDTYWPSLEWLFSAS